MYDLFIGNYQEAMNGRRIYYKEKNNFIPCVATNYYFKSRQYALVPIEDMENIPNKNHKKRRLFYTSKVYINLI